MSPLLTAQLLFTRRLALLLVFVYTHDGWGFTEGDADRPDHQGHMPGSLHYDRLAMDFNLFVDGVYKDQDCPEWQTIGAYWKSLGPECAWGGDFPKVDLNHVSIRFGGKE